MGINDDFIEWETETEEGDEIIHKIPAKRAVCHRCSGKGSHVNPNVDGHGISQEEFDEDPDFRENYFSGVYDVTCYECKGERVVLIVDVDQARTQCPAVLRAYEEHLDDEREYERQCEMERRMGA